MDMVTFGTIISVSPESPQRNVQRQSGAANKLRTYRMYKSEINKEKPYKDRDQL